MSAALVTTEVKTVLRDLGFFASEGVRVAIVEATPDGGVSIGIDGDAGAAAAAEQLLGSRYPFPVTCWPFE
jgi:hypothetical protein